MHQEVSVCTSDLTDLNILTRSGCSKRNCLHEQVPFAIFYRKCMHILKNNKIMFLKLIRVFLFSFFFPHSTQKQCFLTIISQCQRRRRTQNSGICHCVFHQAYVAANIGCLHLGYVEIACLLRDETPAVFCHKRWEFIKYPAIDDL